MEISTAAILKHKFSKNCIVALKVTIFFLTIKTQYLHNTISTIFMMKKQSQFGVSHLPLQTPPGCVHAVQRESINCIAECSPPSWTNQWHLGPN